MIALATAILSILAIALAAWALRRVAGVPICPICLGVGGTWLWMIVARGLGVEFDAAMLPILLGGSVAGAAHLLEKHLPEGRSPLAWNTLFLPVGFAAAYGLARPDWGVFSVSAVVLALLAGVYFLPRKAAGQTSESVEKLKQQMKNCC